MTIKIQFNSESSCQAMLDHFKTHISMFHKEARKARNKPEIVIDTNLSKNEGLVRAALEDELNLKSVTDYTILDNEPSAEIINFGICQEQ